MTSFDGPLFAGMSPGHRARARALAEHVPPTLIWFDDTGRFHMRCITDEPNPDCNGCRETEMPPREHMRFEGAP